MAGTSAYDGDTAVLKQFAGQFDTASGQIMSHVNALQAIHDGAATAVIGQTGTAMKDKLTTAIEKGNKLNKCLTDIASTLRHTAITGEDTDSQGHQEISKVNINFH